MTGVDEPIEADQNLGLPPIFTPARAAEILRSLGLGDMTECALKTRAYRKQVPYHLNGNRITFTLADLREIAEGRAFHPKPVKEADDIAPAPPKAVPPQRRTPARTHVWRARRPPNA